jgi:hypothetical protein
MFWILFPRLKSSIAFVVPLLIENRVIFPAHINAHKMPTYN